MAVRKNSRRRLRREREGAGSTLRPDGKTARRHKYGREVLQDPAAEAGEPGTCGVESVRSPSGRTDYLKNASPAKGNPGSSNIARESPGSTDSVCAGDTDLRGAAALRQDADPAAGMARSPTGLSRKLRSEETASKIRRSRLRMDDAGVDPAGEHVYGGRKPAGESVQSSNEPGSISEGLVDRPEAEAGASKGGYKFKTGSADAPGGRSSGTPKTGKAKAGAASKRAARPEEAAKHSGKLRHPHENTAQKAADAAGRAARSADTDGNVGVQASVFAND